MGMTAPYIDATRSHLVGLQGWLDLLKAEYLGIYGAGIDLGSDSIDGQWLGTLAGHYNDLEQFANAVYLGRAPAGAVGAGLSRLIQLNGINRKSAQFSSVPVTLTGTPGTVLQAGTTQIGSNSDPDKPAFVLAGTSPANDLTIGSSGTVNGAAQCTVAGPVTATAGELTKMLTTIDGWTAVTNTADATPGSLVEADPAARTRRAWSVAIPSQSLTDGLRAALANLTGVSNAKVYENRTAAVDAKGLPAHSINAIVRGGAPADIANAMWLKAGQGVTLVGAQSLSVVDQQGNPQAMQWDLAVDLDVYIIVKLDSAPSNLAYINSSIQAAIVEYFSPTGDLPLDIGDNLAWLDIATPINALGLTGRKGLPSVTQILVGSAPAPTLQADLAVPYNNVAVFDPSRISVVGP